MAWEHDRKVGEIHRFKKKNEWPAIICGLFFLIMIIGALG